MDEDFQIVEVTVRVKIRAGADVYDAISEADYVFTHEDILDTEITDINTEV